MIRVVLGGAEAFHVASGASVCPVLGSEIRSIAEDVAGLAGDVCELARELGDPWGNPARVERIRAAGVVNIAAMNRRLVWWWCDDTGRRDVFPWVQRCRAGVP